MSTMLIGALIVAIISMPLVITLWRKAKGKAPLTNTAEVALGVAVLAAVVLLILAMASYLA